jgi:hypothetical protein
MATKKHVIVVETDEIVRDNSNIITILDDMFSAQVNGKVFITSRWNQDSESTYGLVVPNSTADQKDGFTRPGA